MTTGKTLVAGVLGSVVGLAVGYYCSTFTHERMPWEPIRETGAPLVMACPTRGGGITSYPVDGVGFSFMDDSKGGLVYVTTTRTFIPELGLNQPPDFHFSMRKGDDYVLGCFVRAKTIHDN